VLGFEDVNNENGFNLIAQKEKVKFSSEKNKWRKSTYLYKTSTTNKNNNKIIKSTTINKCLIHLNKYINKSFIFIN
jgi:hypothetical protein